MECLWGSTRTILAISGEESIASARKSLEGTHRVRGSALRGDAGSVLLLYFLFLSVRNPVNEKFRLPVAATWSQCLPTSQVERTLMVARPKIGHGLTPNRSGQARSPNRSYTRTRPNKSRAGNCRALASVGTPFLGGEGQPFILRRTHPRFFFSLRP